MNLTLDDEEWEKISKNSKIMPRDAKVCLTLDSLQMGWVKKTCQKQRRVT